MSKKKKNVTYVTQKVDYNDQWIRERFRDFQTTGAQFTNWMNQRTAQLAGEKQQREQNQAAISKLGLDAAVAQEKLAGLGRGQAGLGSQIGSLSSDFTGALSTIGQQIANQQSSLQSQQAGLGQLGDTISGQGGALTDIASVLQNQQGQIGAQGSRIDQQGSTIGGLGSSIQGLTGDYSKLSVKQQQQIKDLYNLAAQGKDVRGVKTSQGLTFTQRPGSGVGGLNRDSLTFGSLNLA